MNAPSKMPSLPSSISNTSSELPAVAGSANQPISGFLTPPQKAALVIAALGPEAAGPIIERIEHKHLRAFAKAYAQLQTIPRASLLEIVDEFVSRLSSSDNRLKGGFEETRELLNHFISSDELTRLMDDINVPGGQTVWEKLDRTNDDVLAKYLASQNVQSIAVVLSRINTEKASNILGLLDASLAEQVVVRLSRPLQVRREVLRKLSDTIENEFLAPLRNSSKGRNPGEMIGAMLNNIASEKRDSLLSFISSNVPDIVSDVKKSMLTFQELAERVPPNSIAMVIKELEESVFLNAVKLGRKNASESVDFIFKNISQRMAQQYEEQLEAIQNLSVKDGESAQAQFMTTVRKLVAAGEIQLIELASEEDEEEAA